MLLKINSTGKQVEELQKRLNAWGYKPALKVDGRFGQKTEQAVKSFQACHVDSFNDPLVVDGEVGDKTWWAITKDNASEEDDSDTIQISLALRALTIAIDYHAHNVVERPDNSNRGGPAPGVDPKYSVNAIQKPFGMYGQPWCAMTMWNVYTQAGLSLPTSGFASVYKWAAWARTNNYWHLSTGFNPQPGDLFCVGQCTNYSNSFHIGMVEKNNGDGTFTTIEGNFRNRIGSTTRKISSIGGFIRIPGK